MLGKDDVLMRLILFMIAIIRSLKTDFRYKNDR